MIIIIFLIRRIYNGASSAKEQWKGTVKGEMGTSYKDFIGRNNSNFLLNRDDILVVLVISSSLTHIL